MVQGEVMWLRLQKIFEEVLMLSFTDSVQGHVICLRIKGKQ
jgi:hypothetical protein